RAKEAASAGRAIHCDLALQQDTQGVYSTTASLVPYVMEDGDVLGYFMLLDNTAGRRHSHVDVSVQKQRLAYLHRMATTGEMAATLAHDLKQPLQAIKSYSGATTRMLHADKPITEIADIQRRISDQADNARSVVDNVRDFVGHQDVGLVQI